MSDFEQNSFDELQKDGMKKGTGSGNTQISKSASSNLNSNSSPFSTGNYGGYYNHTQHDGTILERTGEGAKQYLKAEFQEAQSVQGVESIKKVGRLVGIGSGSGVSASQRNAARAALNNRTRELGLGNNYNAAAKNINKQLKGVNVNGMSMSARQARKIIRGKHMSDDGSKLKVGSFKASKVIGSDDKQFDSISHALSDAAKLRTSDMQGLSKIANSKVKSKRLSTAKEWANQMLGDSEVMQGYQQTKRIAQIGKTMGKATITTAKVGGKVTAGIVNGVGGGATKIVTSAQIKHLDKVIADGSYEKAYAALLDKSDKEALIQNINRQGLIGASLNKVGSAFKNIGATLGKSVGVKVRTSGVGRFASKISNSRGGKLVGKVGKGVFGLVSAPVKGVQAARALKRKMRERLEQKFAGYFKIKGKAANAKRLFKKIVLIAAGSLVGLMIILSFLGVFLRTATVVSKPVGLIMDFFGGDITSTNEQTKSKIQETVNRLYEIQYAYMINIAHCKKGSFYYPHGIPDSWKLRDAAAYDDDQIDSEIVAVYGDDGRLMGYNLEHYWGPRNINFSKPFEIRTEETIMVPGQELVFPTDGGAPYYIDTETPTVVTKILNVRLDFTRAMAGLRGDIGTYYSNNTSNEGFLNETFEVDKDSAAFQEIADDKNINTEIDIKFHWLGSEYSYKYTPDKAEKYYTHHGEQIDYSVETLYKAFTSAVLAFTQQDMKESADFYFAYCKTLFDNAMTASNVTLTSLPYRTDPTRMLTFTFKDAAGHEVELQQEGWIRPIQLDIYFDQQGLADLINLDYCDNQWIRDNHPRGMYSRQQDWNGWFEADNVTPNKRYEWALTYYDMDSKSFADYFEGVNFPTGFYNLDETGEWLIPFNYYYGTGEMADLTGGWFDGTRVTSPFGRRIHPVTGKVSYHNGIDLSMVSGTGLPAMADCTVIAVGSEANAGNYIKYRTNDGTVICYYHLLYVPNVTVGQQVDKGEQIAVSGNSGRSTGAHLHLEVHPNGGAAVDPRPYLEGTTPLN